MGERSSGILMAISSLPSKYGIGTFGKAAYEFADFLEAAGQKYWQMLPLGPTGFGDSPYQSVSSFAGNPYYIDLDLLIEDGLLTEEEVNRVDWGSDPEKVDYGKLYENRFEILKIAAERGYERDLDQVNIFAARSSWLSDYALFMACKRHFKMVSWLEWPDDNLKKRNPDTLKYYAQELSEDVKLFKYIQFLFYKQWYALRDYIHSKGISIIGDVPIYTSLDSVDVWSEPEEFWLDEELKPVEVAGCPPDAFSKTGQLWGNPLYNWEYMKNNGFGWWIRRIDGISKLYDVIRFDHFRGLDEYWSVPYGSLTAEDGKWNKGPGMSLVSVLNSWFSDVKYIAEDLGFLTQSVRDLVNASGWPSMKVLEFAFDSREESNYLPHFYSENAICYTGTHDNETLTQWFETAPEGDIELAVKYLNLTKEEGYNWGMIRGGMSSVAKLFIAPMQDYLELGEEARMNHPSLPLGWWRWRATEDMLTGKRASLLSAKIRELVKLYSR